MNKTDSNITVKKEFKTWFKEQVTTLNKKEWGFLVLSIALTTIIPISLRLAGDEPLSFALALIGTNLTLFSTFFIAKGKRLGLVMEFFSVFIIGLNLAVISSHGQVLMGYMYMTIIAPMFIFVFFQWGRQNKKTGTTQVQPKSLNQGQWILIMTLFISLMLMGLGIQFGTDTFFGTRGVDVSNSIFEAFSFGAIFIMCILFVFTMKEFWIFELVIFGSNYIVFLTNFIADSNAMALVHLIALTIDIAVSVWALIQWSKSSKKNKKEHAPIETVIV